MGYESFKRTVWAAGVERALERNTFLLEFCGRSYQGAVKHGSEIVIPGIGRPTVRSYTGASITAPEKVEDTSLTMKIDRANYFNFMVDDIEAAQTNAKLLESITNEAGLALAQKKDEDIAVVAAGAKGIYSSATQINSGDLAKSAVDTMLETLWENDVSTKETLELVIPPWFFTYIKDKLTVLYTDNVDLIRTGRVGRYSNAEVRMSNSVKKTSGVTPNWTIFLRTNRAIEYAGQIDSVEPFRPEDYFADAVKGIDVYGLKIVRQAQIVSALIKK